MNKKAEGTKDSHIAVDLGRRVALIEDETSGLRRSLLVVFKALRQLNRCWTTLAEPVDLMEPPRP